MASLVKYHALGNDYLVLDVRERAEMYAVEEIKRVCHRNYGVGSDGILYGPLPSSKALCRLEIWNPDGSQAEKSGNGLRIFARYLYDQGTVSEGVPFTIETLGGTVSCVVNAPDDISIQMGHVSFSSTDIPVSGPPRDVLLEEMRIGDSTIVLSAATIGNPHAVHLTECLTKTLACQWGPLIEKATAVFPKRTNVQFVQVMDRNTIRIEIWERGAGYTLASGSSSCAAASVVYKLGLCDSPVHVHCPGGVIEIELTADFAVTMSGTVTLVGRFTCNEEMFK